MKNDATILLCLFVFSAFASACQATPAVGTQESGATLRVLAAESFLADMAQNVAGDRLKVDALLPLGLDPHAFEPTPKDVAKIADSNVLIVNGAGLEKWLTNILENAGGQRLVIEAAAGLNPKQRSAEGIVCAPPSQAGGEAGQGDPHFWLDPILVIRYVENIRDGLSQFDPQGKEAYASNAEDYISRLKELDTWIAGQVGQMPPERRLLVTNHESLGYYADRYGFKLIGAILPSFSTIASPSAGDLARLADCIKSSRAPAIFLETGTNPQLAEQLARETGIHVVTDLYTESLTPPGGNATDYISMMKYNTQMIVNALK